MAAAQCAIFSSLVPPASATITDPKKWVLISSSSFSSSSVSISFPPKPKRRKNYLRPKLLKTLTKPYTTPLLPQEPPQSPTLPLDSDELETTSDGPSGGDGGGAVSLVEQETTSFVAGHSRVSNARGAAFTTGSVLKFVLWGVGIFVFQTVCAVWVMGSVDSDEKDGILETGSGRKKGKNFMGIGGLMDESELEEKIGHIRLMAREARESEEKELQAKDTVSSLNDFEDDEDAAEAEVSRVRSGIEKEIDKQLIKLEKRLNSSREKSLAKVEDRKQADIAQVKESNGAKLIFEKKLKYRNHSIDSRSKPKGFQNSEDSSHSDTRKSNSGKFYSMPLAEENKVNLLEEDRKALQFDGKRLQNERGRSDMAKKMGFQNVEPRNGVIPETGHGKPSIEGVKLKVSKQVETQKAQIIKQGKQDNGQVSKKSAGLGFGSNSRLKSKGIRSKSASKEVMDKPSNNSTGPWWLNLPFVITIYMCRGFESEGPGGLFTLKSTWEHSDSSYTVAFEDRSDATNFCYILETFFEDLGDVSIDMIPLSIKELKDTLDSHTLKVVVVKKGQIQLYAGQPLADVEMALRSLIEQDQVFDSSDSK